MSPRVGMILGDPGGVGAELVAKLIADPETARHGSVVIVGDEEHLRRGQQIAGTDVQVEVVTDTAAAKPTPERPILVSLPLENAASFPLGEARAEGGRYCLNGLERLLDMIQAGQIDSICFAPLNKHAMKLGGIGQADEMHWFAEKLGYSGHVAELNVLGGLWTSRVTSHVALKDVSDLITVERVIDAVELIDRTLKRAGYDRPKIAVAGLNPHCGDNGSFGREELDVIGPAVDKAKAQGFDVGGPFSPDTMFVSCPKQGYDAIVTMYHDQGQIALKAMGFEQGVSVMGGLPIPAATPAQGTAYDIAGRGIATPSAIAAAFRVAAQMGTAARAAAAE